MNAAARAVAVISSDSADALADAAREALGGSNPVRVATLYYGRGVSEANAAEAARQVTIAAGGEPCEAVYGGQDDPPYLVALE
jgi:hypothetical protein